ncbi:protein-glutamate O-methyltransferase CheR [Sphaerotilus montanus]|uniref:Chemotaxis methyl-accepting protein methylase n=1 Tax=Sphaerotilus montanus TaxID=522889 RepID=A0A7Y9U947_9BURK|nr:protein-glutamate O-methyltransferase CheR [Sphaerotilus montanus]NYG35321.1 chemotaxis methyl-accepting protein methylase [Sphaerotilus montanus]NZD56866.1 protein-glutamate O-methyltransferase CheR [Sphaerotilus montanus]
MTAGPPAPVAATPLGLNTVLELLRAHGQPDFRLYKQRTLLRRLERRMHIHRVPTLQDYARLLRHSSQEVALLSKELLIGVTLFFRDTPVWQALCDTVLPRLLADHADGDVLRAWVAGCSTGEEAYSLAMAFREVVDATPERARCTLQIFATDLSQDAIDRARAGTFPPSLADELSAVRLARHFVQQDGGYRIAASIRDTIVFARHDLTADPPLSRMDLMSCRNLLMHFSEPLQQRILPLFHYSLRPGGVLLLGSSETVHDQHHRFEPLDAEQRLYRRCAGPRTYVMPACPRERSTPSATAAT